MTSMTPVGRLAPQIDARLIWFCAVLLGIDVFFIGMFSIHTIYIRLYNNRVPILGSGWDLERDRSYAEMFGYLKTTLILFLLISMPRVWKRPIYLAFILIFAFVLVDDAFRVHERGGVRLAEALDLQPFGGLRPRDPGELLVWTMVGVPLLAAAAFAIVRSPKEERGNGLLLLGALAVLALFAIGIDMAHVMLVGTFRGADQLFAVIEEGGEQFTLSLTCGLAILIRRDVRGREPRRAAPACYQTTPRVKNRQLSGRELQTSSSQVHLLSSNLADLSLVNAPDRSRTRSVDPARTDRLRESQAPPVVSKRSGR